MRILICDDNPVFCQQLRNYLFEFFQKHHFSVDEIDIYHDGESLLRDNGTIDMLFLDVEMPGKNGIEVGNRISASYPYTFIFIISSFQEYLDDAMRFHVFRYLNKPLDKQRLFRNLEDALQAYMNRTSKVILETRERVISVSTGDIIYVEAQGHDVMVYTTQDTYYSIRPMKYWLNTLTQPCFYQTHRSFLVNMTHIREFDHSLIYFSGTDHTAYLTRRNYQSFKQSYLAFLEGTRSIAP